MASRNSNKGRDNQANRPKIDREKRRLRVMTTIFFAISIILILSMVLAAVGKF